MEQHYKRYRVAVDEMYRNLSDMVNKNIFTDKKVYMFGTSKIASMIISYLSYNGIKLTGIIDNDMKKQGYVIENLKVDSPEILRNYDSEVVVLIASSYQNEMIKQLEDMNYEYEKNIIKVIDLPKLMGDYSFIDRSGYKLMPKNEIKIHQIEMMKYIRNICDENGIDYYLAYGTLLGAVRHRGFIPWDDDIDIYVKGKDIDKLADIINKSNRYQMFTCRNNSKFLDQLPIVIDKDSVVDFNCFPLQATMGIWIDIFPLYGLPSGENEVKEYASKIKEMEMRKWNCLYDEEKCHIEALKLDEFISSYDFDEAEYTGYFLSPYFTKDYLKTAYFKNKDYFMFEEEKFCVPMDYAGVLETIYGDYMQLPPEDKRGERHYYKTYYSR